MDPVLERLLSRHRYFGWAEAALWVVVLALTAGAFVAVQNGQGYIVDWVTACGLALALLIGVSRINYVTMRQLLTDHLGAQQTLLRTANRDRLTGAYNRSYFMDFLKQNIGLESQHSVGYMQVDLDNLKQLNDSSGHAAGDAALAHLVATIEKLAPQALIGRLGGDEFGIAIVGHDNKAGLRRLGDQMLEALSAPTQIGGRTHRISATIGVTIAPDDGVEVDQIIANADLALYQGKRGGRHSTVAFSRDMLADERHRRFVERDLRAAILLDEIELHYQPVFDVKGAVTSYEALVRWQHNVRGLVAPGEFIPVAEQSDLIDMIGDWVLRRACRDRSRLAVPVVAVNVSAVQLRRPDFAHRFAAILRETATSGTHLIVEITETVPLSAGAIETANLETLRAMGVRIAIDDFGAGHASLEYLRNFKFDILKLDRSLVADIETSQLDFMLTGSICRIASAIGVAVVAEGVETEAQRDALTALGCTHLQGFLLGRPGPLALPQVLRAEVA